MNLNKFVFAFVGLVTPLTAFGAPSNKDVVTAKLRNEFASAVAPAESALKIGTTFKCSFHSAVSDRFLPDYTINLQKVDGYYRSGSVDFTLTSHGLLSSPDSSGEDVGVVPGDYYSEHRVLPNGDLIGESLFKLSKDITRETKKVIESALNNGELDAALSPVGDVATGYSYCLPASK